MSFMHVFPPQLLAVILPTSHLKKKIYMPKHAKMMEVFAAVYIPT